MLGQRPMKIEDYFRIIKKRFWLALIPGAVLCAATYLVSLKIPDRFTSQTLILIEQQKVPDTYVKTIVTGDLNERLASMQEQILSRTRLMPEVQRFDLFSNTGLPMDDRVDELRKVIVVTPVRPMEETASQLPGFGIAVTLNTARVAQQVCADITSMFIEQSLKDRESETDSTVQFLDKELDEAKQSLDQQGQKLAEFKQRNLGGMPADEQTNMNLLNTLSTQLDSVNQVLSRDQQNRNFLQGQLDEQVALAKKANEHPEDMPLTDAEALQKQLERAQNDLTLLRSQFTDSYPDVVAKKAEIEQLRQKVESSKAPPTKAAVVQGEASNSKDAVDTAKAGSAGATETKPSSTTKDANAAPAPEGPQVKQLRTQIFVIDQEIHEKAKVQDRLRSDIGKYEARLHLSPMVEQQYEQLTRDQVTAKDIYDDRLRKRDNARMASNLERRQQGETFNILDPASLPEKPSFPNRPLFAGGGFVGGLALGIGLILLLEYRDRSIVAEHDVEYFLKLPTLATVPYIQDSSISRVTGIVSRFRRKQTAELGA